MGFTDVGRTNERGKIEDTQDLVVIVRTLDNCRDTLDANLSGFIPPAGRGADHLNEEVRSQSPVLI